MMPTQMPLTSEECLYHSHSHCNHLWSIKIHIKKLDPTFTVSDLIVLRCSLGTGVRRSSHIPTLKTTTRIQQPSSLFFLPEGTEPFIIMGLKAKNVKKN